MKLVLRVFIVSCLLFTAQALFGVFQDNKVEANCSNVQTGCDIVQGTFTNSSGYTLNLFYSVLGSDTSCTTGPVNSPPTNASCVEVNSGTIWSSLNGTDRSFRYERDTDLLHHYTNYYIWWYAKYADYGGYCVDPVNKTISWGNLNSWYIYSANITVTCSIPPPATITPATNLTQNASCASATSTSVNVAFAWNKATGITIFEQWLDYSLVNDNFATGPPYQGNINVGTSATTNSQSNFAQSKTYYWRINTKSSAGIWYTSSTKSFTTPNCGQIGLLGSVSCSGNVSVVNLGWNSTAGGTVFNIYRGTTLMATVQNTNQWSWNADAQGAQYNWQVYDSAFGKYSNVISLTTATCGSPPPASISLNVSTGCSGPTPTITLSWNNTGEASYNILKDGSAIASVTGSTWGPSAIDNLQHTWQVKGNSTGTLSNSKTVTAPPCATIPSPDC